MEGQGSHRITLTVTTGRSGTVFLHNSLQESFGSQLRSHHELTHPSVTRPARFLNDLDGTRQLAVPEIADVVERLVLDARQTPVVEFGWTSSMMVTAVAKRAPSQVQVLQLVRHPVPVAASFAVLGHYHVNSSPDWAITPLHDGVAFPQFAERWPSMSPFERGLYRWLEITAFGLRLAERLPETPYLLETSERLFKETSRLEAVAEFVRCPAAVPVRRSEQRNSIGANRVERYPIGDEWRRMGRHPEVTEMAERFGYDCSEGAVHQEVTKYLLPRTLGAVLRHKSGYWPAREFLGKVRSALAPRS